MRIGDPWCVTSWRARPGSFVGLMTLYESNFLRLSGLCGELRALPDRGCATIDAAITLKFQVEERGPYTTLLSLRPDAGPGADPLPELRVRVYHDARVVEAAEVRLGERPVTASVVSGDGLLSRWARNMLLNKWLEYCVDRGCRFIPAAQPS